MILKALFSTLVIIGGFLLMFIFSIALGELIHEFYEWYFKKRK